MRQSGFEPVEGSRTSVLPANEPGIHHLDPDRNLFRLLLEIESRLRKQAREESRMAFARRRIFRDRNDGRLDAAGSDSAASKKAFIEGSQNGLQVSSGMEQSTHHGSD
jgi:hypothetical protein